MNGITDRVYRLARMMHVEYELISKEIGWKTQESCQVDFDQLPVENRQVMCAVAHKVLERIANEIRP